MDQVIICEGGAPTLVEVIRDRLVGLSFRWPLVLLFGFIAILFDGHGRYLILLRFLFVLEHEVAIRLYILLFSLHGEGGCGLGEGHLVALHGFVKSEYL
jgi:hypothetical protein